MTLLVAMSRVHVHCITIMCVIAVTALDTAQ